MRNLERQSQQSPNSSLIATELQGHCVADVATVLRAECVNLISICNILWLLQSEEFALPKRCLRSFELFVCKIERLEVDPVISQIRKLVCRHFPTICQIVLQGRSRQYHLWLAEQTCIARSEPMISSLFSHPDTLAAQGRLLEVMRLQEVRNAWRRVWGIGLNHTPSSGQHSTSHQCRKLTLRDFLKTIWESADMASLAADGISEMFSINFWQKFSSTMPLNHWWNDHFRFGRPFGHRKVEKICCYID